jgi:hypothetical protein
MKTQIRKGPKGYEVWYSTDGGQTIQFHKAFKSMDDAVKETGSLKGHQRLLMDLRK